MDLRNDKRLRSYLALSLFFSKNITLLTTAIPAMATAIAQFEDLKDRIWVANGDVLETTMPTTAGKNQLKAACLAMVWKLASAMKSHFAITNNTVEANNIKISIAGLQRLSENDFYTYAQMVMNLYDPPVYVPFGISEAEMDILKAHLLSFPNAMQATKEIRHTRRNAGIQLKDLTAEMRLLLNTEIDSMMETLRIDHSFEYDYYRNSRHIGLVNPTRGNPHKHGILAPSELVVLDKHPYRRKRALYVTNLGNAPLLAGIGVTETELHGTPFTIAPGKTRQRISQKLAPDGEYFLLQNSGEQEVRYEVWMKE